MQHNALEKIKPQLFSSISSEDAQHYPNTSIENKVFDNRYYLEHLANDIDHINSFGLDAATIMLEIREACEALESAELLHQSDGDDLEEAERVWAEKKEGIQELLSEAHTRLNYVAHTKSKPEIVSELQKIQEGSGYKDAILDLGAMHLLASHYVEELTALNYGADKIALLHDEFKLLSAIYPKVTAERSLKDDAILLRNRAFWYLDSLEQHLKKALIPMLFWNDSGKRKLYVSPTKKEANRRLRKKKSDEVVAE